ncbi:hypothetical protein K788_0005161 [Paraburkholderia caribensis MBA4]|uniref:Uncharacterized protein n=1 Tax=Paraburkholderia caribensis MBA4 TaxID=1323664 RepID=A0A0P0RFV4_9BURK|nr:hypothetical protein K788_0005161 [Paraburkholderia caribensis MBA4]
MFQRTSVKPASKSGVGRLFRRGEKHYQLRPVSVTLPMYNGSKRLRLILHINSHSRAVNASWPPLFDI